MFQLQRERATELISDEDNSQFDGSKKHHKRRIERLEKELEGFEMTTRLDKELLLGILVRNNIGKKGK